MPEKSRTSKSIHNSIVALSYYAINLILQFFSRKVFLDYLGTEILGLNTTAMNLLQFLNLAELGIGSAVGFSLYKPIYNNDHNTINEIIALQGKLYKRIGIFIAAGAVILMCFFPLIFKKISLPLWYAFASFGVLLFSALLGYFVNYKQILLSASQKDYKIQYSYKTIILVKILFQMIAVYWLPNGYIWWLILEAVFSAIASWSLHRTTVKEFPHLKAIDNSFKNLSKKYGTIVTKIKQLFFHKIGGFALNQTSPLIIYAYIDLTVVALYGNYMLIITGINMMVGAMFNSMGAGIGNLVAENNELKIKKVFEELFSLRFVISASLTAAVIYFGPAFVSLWIGKEYLLPFSTLILMSSLMFISLSRYTVESFVAAFGLYADIWAPIVEASLNIGLSILLGKFYGLNGIISGVIISQIIIILCWKPYYLFTRAIPGFLSKYCWIFFSHLFIATGLGIGIWYLLRYFINNADISYISLVVDGAFVTLIFAISLVLVLSVISPGMRYSLKRIKNIIVR